MFGATNILHHKVQRRDLSNSKHSSGSSSNDGTGFLMKIMRRRGSVDLRYASLTSVDQISNRNIEAKSIRRRSYDTKSVCTPCAM